MQKHRISTDIGKDQFIRVELKQEFDLLEILSLKFTQKEAYSSYCSDYGVVCGRIIVNNGLGVPNAKISIFVPLSDEDADDPVISALYPYKSVSDRNDDNYRYNLLPSNKQHGGHEPTGTFPDQTDILNRDEVLEVYEKYYKYTVKTNESGDFMIWGVPLGNQTLHVDVDLSDIGCFSLRPYDFIRQGKGEDQFKNSYSFKSSDDIDSLPQIVSFDKTIEVYPFWGNESICEIGITRSDFDLSNVGVKIEPKAILIGGIYTDSGKNSINKNCQPKQKMGRKCDLITKTGKVEAIRFTNHKDKNNYPILETYTVDEDIPEDGSFVIPIPMNMDYVYTNEFGENEYTNNPDKGIATSACYRFKFTMDDSGNDRTRKTASYLVPNIREYQTDNDEKEKSYAFSTTLTDYPTLALSDDPNRGILFNINGQYFPRDYFYRMNYNKVYTISSFQNIYYRGDTFSGDRFLGIKEIVPSEEEDCAEIVTLPVNFGIKNSKFSLLISQVLLLLEQINNLVTLVFFNTLAKAFHAFADAVNFWPIRRLSKLIRKFAYRFQNSTQKELFLITYPECEECNGDNEYGTGSDDPELGFCEVGTIQISGSTVEDSGNRKLKISNPNFINPTGDCSGAHIIYSMNDLMNRQSEYVLTVDSIGISLDSLPISYNSSLASYVFNDPDQIFPDSSLYTVTVRDKNKVSTAYITLSKVEEGCELYDIPYNENIVSMYYIGTGRTPSPTYTPGDDISATKLSDTSRYPLPNTYEGDVYQPITPSGYTEFTNGIFQVIPGSLSNRRIIQILREYRRRKRVAMLFCGGIVNYSFIDNWLSGSLYFFQFKGKKGKYCEDVIRYSTEQETFYYRSAIYTNETTWGVSKSHSRHLGRPTTMVDLGPRDEFINEICMDESIDPNCSVARSIGPTSFQNFGEILGMAINYKLDVGNNEPDINNFFENGGFKFTDRVFNGDIMQLISINNEAGIEEFDLQNTRYLGYSYQYLDPELYQNVFKNGGTVYGPLPITFYFDEDGDRIRACLNTPGSLTESSQKVPFFLWDKKGRGFGSTTDSDLINNQSWDYSNTENQPLQGMTYGYLYNDDPDDKYLLLPMTYTFSGVTIPANNSIGVADFDIIDYNGDNHTLYNLQYPGFTYLYVLTVDGNNNPLTGIRYTRVGAAGTNGTTGWDIKSWTYNDDFIIRKTEDYYSSNKQILSTPFMFYFGLKSGRTGLDKFIKLFGPKGAFPSVD